MPRGGNGLYARLRAALAAAPGLAGLLLLRLAPSVFPHVVGFARRRFAFKRRHRLLDGAYLAHMARDAEERGENSRAQALLRAAIAAEPASVAHRVALAEFLARGLRHAEAQAVAAGAVQYFPTSVEARIALARIERQRRHFAEAVATIEGALALDQGSAWAWFEYAMTTRASPQFAINAEDAFARAGDLCGDDARLLEALAEHYLTDREYAKALTYYDKLFALDPRARANPTACRLYADCLQRCGRSDEAARIIAWGLAQCRRTHDPPGSESWELIKQSEASLLSLAGRTNEATGVLRSIRASAPDGPRYGRPEYLPDTARRLRRLADIIDGRDLLVLLQGPSFSEFADRITEFSLFDFAVASLGSFPPIEQELQRIDRRIDVLLLSHPSSIRSWYGEFRNYLSRPRPNLLVTTRYALSELGEFGTSERELVARHGERLLLAHHAGGPPLPSRPLHFEDGNSLTLLLPVLSLGRPKRIFLFGADAGGNPTFGKRPYFFYDDYDAEEPPQPFLERPDMVSFRGRPDRLEAANRRFRIDSLNADRIIAASLRDLQVLFDVPTPPIFNVCPHSAHAAFPRIGLHTALAMLKSGGPPAAGAISSLKQARPR